MAKNTREVEEEVDMFEDEETFEVLPQSEEVTPDEAEEEEFTIRVPDESPADRKARLGLKEKADGRVLTIQKVFHTKPKLFDKEGNKIAPKKTLKGDGDYYPGKLGIRFEEDSLVEYYPSFHYNVNDGVVSKTAKVNRTGNNEVTKLFRLAVKAMGMSEDEVSDKAFYDFLVGKEVEIKTVSGVYNKKPWFRNDIVRFIGYETTEE